MAKVVVDKDLCTGCGLCVESCSAVFEMNDDNIAKVKASECSDCDLSKIAEECPVEAIKIEG